VTAFEFLAVPARPAKPRATGLTEIRGPYATLLGPRALRDVLELAGAHVDSLKFPGASFALVPEDRVRELVAIAHEHEVKVSTGGFLEWVLMRDPAQVPRFLRTAAELGFDVAEISTGYLTVGPDDLLRLVDVARDAGLVPKPEIAIQVGAGSGIEDPAALAAIDAPELSRAVHTGRRLLEHGVELLMVESEGITETVDRWRREAVEALVDALGERHLMFEAADPAVMSWLIARYGPDVNLFIDHSQVLIAETFRRGTWGDERLFGRVVRYP
jgi:phosphosulfolactate synthase (CoM biosynthesis protein A)